MVLEGSLIFTIAVTGVAFMFLHFQLVAMMEIDLTHGEPMVKNDDNYLNLDNVRVRKVNRTHHLLIGNFTLHVNQGNEYVFFVKLYKKAGNAYKMTPYKMGPKKFCDFLRSEKFFYPNFRATTDFPDTETCPWPKNVYNLFGYSAKFNSIPPTLSSGDYMLEAYTELKGKLQNGYRFYGILTNNLNL